MPDSAQEFCLIFVGFRARIWFDIYWIPQRNLYILHSRQKFCLIYVGLRTEILLDACCISHRNSVKYLLDSVQNLCSGN
jgi:hypothetical protein